MPKGPNQLAERVPIEVGAIQVNFCKNPQCQNFGIPASTARQPRGRGAAERGRDTYSVVGSGRGTPIFMVSLQQFMKHPGLILLGIPDSKVAVKFILHENQKDLGRLFPRLAPATLRLPPFFDPKTKTIHLRTDNITMGILGHEIAHAVLADYFVIHPTHDIGEILSQQVEKKLTAENFTVCVSRKV